METKGITPFRYGSIAFISKSKLEKYEEEHGAVDLEEIASTVLEGKYKFVGIQTHPHVVGEAALFEAIRLTNKFSAVAGDKIQIAENGNVQFEFNVSSDSEISVEGVWDSDTVTDYIVSHPDIKGETKRVSTEIGGKELCLNGRRLCFLSNGSGDGWYSLFFSNGELR